MFLFTPKVFILFFIQVSFTLNLVQAVCDVTCVSCAEDGISCERCPEGYGLNGGPTSCTICPSGSSSLGFAECGPCGRGAFSPEGSYFCIYCGGGGVRPTSDLRRCEPCPVNHYAPPQILECTPCPMGEYSFAGASECISCAPGTYSIKGALFCSSCPTGEYFSGPSCSSCPRGTVPNSLANGCESCPAGSIPRASQGSCVPCGSGLWANPGDSECSSCGPNCDACESNTTCAECTYPTKNKNGICVFICPKGQFATSSGCRPNCQECTSKSECTICKAGYIYQLDEDTGFYACSPKPKNPEKDATKSTAASLGATSTVAKSISSGSSGSLGFGVVAKVIRNVRYFNITYSNKTLETFAAEGSSSFEFNAPGSFDETETKELHENFVKYNVEPNFLINYWSNLIPILILCGWFVILKILKKYLGQSRGKILSHKVVIMIQITAGNYLINSLYGSFDQIVFYFILEVQTCTFNSALSWISFLSALGFLIVGLGFFCFHFYILTKYQAAKCQKDVENSDGKRLENFKAQHAHVKVLFEDFKDDSLTQQSFLASFMIRASLLNILLCFFVNYPLAQAFLYLGVNLIFAVFLVIKRPYQELKGAVAQYFCEAIILITYSCALVLALMDHNGADAKSARRALEKVIMLLGIGLNVGGTVYQCLDIFIGVCLYIKTFKIWRARLKLAKAPVGLVSTATGNHVDLTFMKVKSGLKVDHTPEDGGLASLSGSPTRLISRNLDTEMERLSSPFTNSTRRPSTTLFTGESQDDLDYNKRTRVFEITRESEIMRIEDISRRSGFNSASIRRRNSTIVFTGESQNDLDYHKKTGVFEINRESEARIEEKNQKNILSYSIRKTNSTIVFTGESENDPDYHKKTGVFEIDPESVTKRDVRKRIISALSEQGEKEGEAVGDLMVFDYEKAQKVNKAKEMFRPS